MSAENYLNFKGNFENDLPNGDGKIIYKNGDEFKGKFMNGKKEGKGILNLKANRKIIEGEWK